MESFRYYTFFAILSTVLLLAGCIAVKVPTVLIMEDIAFETRKTTAEIPEYTQIRTATLSAVGDILLHSTVYNAAKTEEGYDFGAMFEKVKPYMERSDITVANSESIIGGTGIGLSTYPNFNSPFEIGDTLKDVGVDVVAMANNHTLDRGLPAIENALNYWDQIGVKRTGSYLSQKEREQITAITANDIKFSFLSYTYGTNGVPAPPGKEYLVNRIDKEMIKADLAQAKAQSDVVVLNLHFGDEYQPLPNDSQLELAQFAADNGADIILGHHPHVLQPPAWIDAADGRRVFVVYSLGNFLSGQNEIQRQIGTILTIEVEKKMQAGRSQIALKNPSFTNTFVKNENYRWFEIDLLKNVYPDLNEEVKIHLSKWINDVAFYE